MSSDAPPSWLLALIPVGFLIGFPLLWAAVVFLLSRMSGWSTLARTYGAREPFAGTLQRRCSGTLGIVGYNKCLALGANEQGLHISVPRIFAIGHPALFVPWSEIRASRKKQLWVPTVGFELGKQSPIVLRMHQRFADGLESSALGQLQVVAEKIA